MICSFKSYYVVWKQNRPSCGYQSSDRFKSYYVVWKQKKIAYMETDISMFKSYYVVWKLSKQLNRFDEAYVV